MSIMTEENEKILRQVSASVAKMSPHARQHEHENARLVVESLHRGLPGMQDSDLASVSFILASVMSSLNMLNVRELADTLERSTAAYSLGAAHLRRFYDIEDDPTAEPEPEPAADDWRPGGYL